MAQVPGMCCYDLLCNKKTWIFSELKGVTAKVRHAPDGQVKNLSICVNQNLSIDSIADCCGS